MCVYYFFTVLSILSLNNYNFFCLFWITVFTGIERLSSGPWLRHNVIIKTSKIHFIHNNKTDHFSVCNFKYVYIFTFF